MASSAERRIDSDSGARRIFGGADARPCRASIRPVDSRATATAMYDRDLNAAAHVHHSFLPEPIDNAAIDLAFRYLPIQTLGGDFCSAFWASDTRLIVCMCDVTGHGVTSALYAARINSFVLSHARAVSHPDDLVVRLNRFLYERLSAMGVYTAFFSAYIDLDCMQLAHANAALPPPIRYSDDTGECTRLEPEITLLGIGELPVSHGEGRSVALRSGDKLLMYTDGLIERPNGAGLDHGITGLQGVLRRHARSSSDVLCDTLLDWSIEAFGPPHDDQLVMVVTIK